MVRCVAPGSGHHLQSRARGTRLGWSRHAGEGRTPRAGRSELSNGRGPSLGWMSSDRRGGRWPAVLLHPEAFLGQAVPSVLAGPPGDLGVHVGVTTRTVAEILLIAEPDVAGRAAGMIRL